MTETCIMGLIKFVVADSVHLSVFNMMDHKEVNSTTRKLHRAITGTDKTRVSGAKDCSVFATKYRVSQEEWTKLRGVFLMLNYTDITQNTYIQS